MKPAILILCLVLLNSCTTPRFVGDTFFPHHDNSYVLDGYDYIKVAGKKYESPYEELKFALVDIQNTRKEIEEYKAKVDNKTVDLTALALNTAFDILYAQVTDFLDKEIKKAEADFTAKAKVTLYKTSSGYSLTPDGSDVFLNYCRFDACEETIEQLKAMNEQAKTTLQTLKKFLNEYNRHKADFEDAKEEIETLNEEKDSTYYYKYYETGAIARKESQRQSLIINQDINDAVKDLIQRIIIIQRSHDPKLVTEINNLITKPKGIKDRTSNSNLEQSLKAKITSTLDAITADIAKDPKNVDWKTHKKNLEELPDIISKKDLELILELTAFHERMKEYDELKKLRDSLVNLGPADKLQFHYDKIDTINGLLASGKDIPEKMKTAVKKISDAQQGMIDWNGKDIPESDITVIVSDSALSIAVRPEADPKDKNPKTPILETLCKSCINIQMNQSYQFVFNKLSEENNTVALKLVDMKVKTVAAKALGWGWCPFQLPIAILHLPYAVVERGVYDVAIDSVINIEYIEEGTVKKIENIEYNSMVNLNCYTKEEKVVNGKTKEVKTDFLNVETKNPEPNFSPFPAKQAAVQMNIVLGIAQSNSTNKVLLEKLKQKLEDNKTGLKGEYIEFLKRNNVIRENYELPK